MTKKEILLKVAKAKKEEKPNKECDEKTPSKLLEKIKGKK